MLSVGISQHGSKITAKLIHKYSEAPRHSFPNKLWFLSNKK